MVGRILGRLRSPSMGVAIVAVVIAGTGSAVAAGTLITAKQIKHGTIQLVDISKGAQTALKGNLGPRGPQGPQGPQGTPGAAGAPATALFVSVNGGASGATTAPVPLAGSASTFVSVARQNSTDQGRYDVTFNRNVSACVDVASITDVAGGAGTPGYVLASPGTGTTADEVFVRTTDTTGTDANNNFSLAVYC